MAPSVTWSYSDIRFWAQFGVIKDLYPINENAIHPINIHEDYIKVPSQDLSTLDPDRWVEVPMDYLPKSGECIAASTRHLTLRVEKKNADGTWPRTKQQAVDEEDASSWLQRLECGDIVDVKDEFDEKWYECLIRCVYPKHHSLRGLVVIHYIGIDVQWDEQRSITAHRDQFALRGAH